jgi:hypothetical protein
MKAFLVGVAFLASALGFSPLAPGAEPLKIEKLAERKVQALPPGELYWHIEGFGSLEGAQAAAGTHGLAAKSHDGKAWLFTLAAKGGSGSGAGTSVAEVGPIPRFAAPEYLLRINEASGAPGATTSVHSHPGSEAFYVLAGEQSIRGPSGILKLHPGDGTPGNGAAVPMQATSTGETGLHALVMFVLDANQPFSTPAHMP